MPWYLSLLGSLAAVGVMFLINPIACVAAVVLESLCLTLFGLLVGFALAVGLVFSLRDGIDLTAFASGLNALGVGTTVIPLVRAQDFTTPTVVATLTAIVSSLWPAVRAARALPAHALRHV